MAKKINHFKDNFQEISYNIINSVLSGALVLVGAFATGQITKEAIIIASITSLGVAIAKFKEYWDGEKGEYSTKLFKFL